MQDFPDYGEDGAENESNGGRGSNASCDILCELQRLTQEEKNGGSRIERESRHRKAGWREQAF